jgi:hypothetical protein
VEIDGRLRGFDLLNAFSSATVDDWRALIAATGRGTRALAQGFDSLTKLAQAGAEFDAAVELASLDTVADLLFLARRKEGDRGSYAELVGELPYWQVMQGILRAANEQHAEDEAADAADPMTAPTASSPTARGESGDSDPQV